MENRFFKTLAFALLLGICSVANGQVNLPDFDGQKNREQTSPDSQGVGGSDIDDISHRVRHQKGEDMAGAHNPGLDEAMPDMMPKDETYSLEQGNSRKKVALKGTKVTIDNITYDVARDTAIVYSGNSCSGAVTIPSSITSNGNTYCVTMIGHEAFRDCSSLTSITIPNSVITIGYYAFSGCSSLKEFNVDDNNPYYCSEQGVLFTKDKTNLIYYPNAKATDYVIPNSVITIGYAAFYGCSSLTSIIIPNSVTTIDFEAFSGCSSLTRVNIGNSVMTIGYYAFYGCSSLKEFNMDDNNPYYCSVQGVLFTKDKTTLICYPNAKGADYVIPNSVTTIGHAAFYGCSSLTPIIIPNSVTTIGSWAFACCSSLTSVEIPNSVTTIDKSAFRECSSLTSVTIPNSVTTIDNYVFFKCSSLASITIPNSVTAIGESAFEGCNSLTSFSIPNSVTQIGNYAFYGCSSLTSVYCKIKKPLSIYSSTFTKVPLSSAKLFVPIGSRSAYSGARYWKNFANIIEIDFSIKGDMNEDEMLNVSDATSLINHLLGTESLPNVTKADLNADGVVNVSDVTALINLILAQ